MLEVIKTFAVLASIFNILSGATYFKQVLKGESVPNPATWLIWFVVTILNTLTYFFVVKGNLWVSLASIVLATEILLIFLLSLFKGKFSRLGGVEIGSLLLACIVGIFWQVSGDAVISNLCLQVIFVISFYPTFHNVWFKGYAEKPLPWFLSLGSYALQIVNVLLNPVTLFALAFPIVNFLGNGIIGLTAVIKSRRV
jgi:hypothetical protein